MTSHHLHEKTSIYFFLSLSRCLTLNALTYPLILGIMEKEWSYSFI